MFFPQPNSTVTISVDIKKYAVVVKRSESHMTGMQWVCSEAEGSVM